MTEQIALIEVPVRDITGRRSHRLVAEAGEMEVLGNRCRVMSTGRQFEFWVGARRFEVSLEDLAASAAAAIAGHLKAEIAAQVMAGRRVDRAAEGDGFVTLHPPVHRPVEPLP